LALPFHLQEVEVILAVLGGVAATTGHAVRALMLILVARGWTKAATTAVSMTIINVAIATALMANGVRNPRDAFGTLASSAATAFFLLLLSVVLLEAREERRQN
jgi:hypothetical protein